MDYLKSLEQQHAILNSKYEIIQTLNQGSFGTVVKALDTASGRHVAIKFIPLPDSVLAQSSASDIKIDELSEELAAHSAVTGSDMVVSMLDTFTVDGHKCLVMEYCDNGDLFEWIKAANRDRLDGKRDILTVDESRDIMLQLVDCIEYIHSKGVYHRDLKPENVLIGDDGRLKLADFGLATFASESFEVRLGSDKYMAPEQYSNPTGSYESAKVDIWALGICIGNLLFDSHPFAVADPDNGLFRDYCADRQSLYTTFPNLAPGGYDVISLCLKPDAADRDLGSVRRAILAASAFTVDQEISMLESSPAPSHYGGVDWRGAASGLSTRVQSAAVSFRDSAIGSFGSPKRSIPFDSPFPAVSDSVPIIGGRPLFPAQSVSWADIDADNDADFDDIGALGSYWSLRTPLSTIDDVAEHAGPAEGGSADAGADEQDDDVFVIEDIPAVVSEQAAEPAASAAAAAPAVTVTAPLDTTPRTYVARPSLPAGGLHKWSRLGQTRQAASPETGKPAATPVKASLAAPSTAAAGSSQWAASPTLKRARRPSDSRQIRNRAVYHPSVMAADWRSTPKSGRVLRPSVAAAGLPQGSPAGTSLGVTPPSKRRSFVGHDSAMPRRAGPTSSHLTARAGMNARRNSGATPFWLSSFRTSHFGARSSMALQVS